MWMLLLLALIQVRDNASNQHSSKRSDLFVYSLQQ